MVYSEDGDVRAAHGRQPVVPRHHGGERQVQRRRRQQVPQVVRVVEGQHLSRQLLDGRAAGCGLRARSRGLRRFKLTRHK